MSVSCSDLLDSQGARGKQPAHPPVRTPAGEKRMLSNYQGELPLAYSPNGGQLLAAVDSTHSEGKYTARDACADVWGVGEIACLVLFCKIRILHADAQAIRPSRGLPLQGRQESEQACTNSSDGGTKGRRRPRRKEESRSSGGPGGRPAKE